MRLGLRWLAHQPRDARPLYKMPEPAGSSGASAAARALSENALVVNACAALAEVLQRAGCGAVRSPATAVADSAGTQPRSSRHANIAN